MGAALNETQVVADIELIGDGRLGFANERQMRTPVGQFGLPGLHSQQGLGKLRRFRLAGCVWVSN